ncbi:DNA ligase D [Corallococcus llansteffanensis]|uniref:DNA ligase (ATP) n=1 Tax=Corallococcus llansteffanensis TaxID=2316731 RepID=A0A3A8Q8Q5_9BACT|nr:DNA ligase D [Corallococcus llansteffanensis]RKH64996.1 DNA ligase D [Corallococcus llansteffanensis]
MKTSDAEARLRRYRTKRDFHLTPEPAPDAAAPLTDAPVFVIHKHDATRLHYDLRLEIGGVLVSWAIPKGPSFDPAQKRLAVQTEDHPRSYADFEGHIPDDQYGGGDSLLWESGTFETVPPNQADAQLARGHLEVVLHGSKLQGRWHLIRTRPRGGKAQWLFFKAKDGFARPDYDVTVERPESVKSGQVATQGPRKPGVLRRKPVVAKAAAKRPRKAPANPEQLLERVWPPMLARLAVSDEVHDDTHDYEVKYDGFRAVFALTHDKVSFQSRRGNDLSGRFARLTAALRNLPASDVVVDGEIVALDDKGRSRFQLLQRTEDGVEQRFIVFDVLWLNGEDLRALPYEERRARLEKLMASVELPLQLSERLELPLSRALSEARRRGWEGIIAKRRGSPYTGTRSGDWLKLKVVAGQEVVILGYLPIKNARAKSEIGALRVGVRGKQGFHDVGKVGTGYTTKDRRELRWLLDATRVKKPAAVDAPARSDTVWVKPKYVAQVHFTEWTRDGRLRHPVFQGLRSDKVPEDVVRENPAPTEGARARKGSRRAPVQASARTATHAAARQAATKLAKKAATKTVAKAPKKAVTKSATKASTKALRRSATHDVEVALTHGDRVLFPETGLTKEDVFDYYREVAPLLVPVLADRPLSHQQWPAGIAAPGFFRHELSGIPAWMPTLTVRHEDKTLRHVNVKDASALLWLANQSAFTLHMWLSHAPRLAQPDFVVFDLDPGTGGWKDVVKVARRLHARLDALGLKSFPKTSGKRGLHVLVPLAPGHTYARTQAFANARAAELEEALGDIATTERSIDQRGGRLYLDAMQNARGKTVVAPYSLRAVEGAPFSAPLDWSEVDGRLDPHRFRLKTLKKRLDAVGDLFAPALRTKQTLPEE